MENVPSEKYTKVLSFKEVLKISESLPGYDTSKWIYFPNFYTEYRYILGTVGNRPIITIGINPSTAQAGELDNTLKSVVRVANRNGLDSFIMLNVYAQRATKPTDMDKEFNVQLHKENMEAFRWALEHSGGTPAIWAAWGTLIGVRPYLKDCLRDMIEIAKEYGVRWVTAGTKSKAGHPHHPLYLPKESYFEDFDIEQYLEKI